MNVNQRGNSIVGAVIAIGCVTIMISVSANFLVNARKTTSTMMQINVRDKIQSTLKMVIRTPTSILMSQAKVENPELKKCLQRFVVFDPDEPGDCPHNVRVPFTLYGPMKGSGKIADRDPAAVEYNSMGAPVNKLIGEEVAMSVKSWFRAQCPSKTYDVAPPVSCDVPEAIEIIYEMETKSDGSKKSATLKRFKENIVFPISEISTNVPSIDNDLRPIPDPIPEPPPGAPPPPPTSGGGSSSGSGSAGAPPVPHTPPPTPLNCVGETIQVGSSCACPPGQVLVWPRKGKCARISR